jgi:endonuclease YncB( thermonuclease family)
MSKHWKPPGRDSRFSRSEIRLALLGGLLLGLVYVQASGSGLSWSGGEAVEADFRGLPTPDPYAEARRSLENLRDQENGPIPIEEPTEPETRTRQVGRDDIVDVIDGDTFRLGGEKIRIADIDTPETAGRCPEESALAARATERLAVLLAQGPFELQPIGRDEDRYGRKLRIVTRGGRSIGDQLVAEGLARTWSGRREPWCA